MAAALPGGDPLAAALAAGETPSPEMVAASGEKEGLQPRTAMACFVGVVLMLVALVLLANKTTLLGRAPLPLPPDALADRARVMLKQFGYNTEFGTVGGPVDSAYGFEGSGGIVLASYLRYLEASDVEHRWERLGSLRPALTVFWYRQHQDYLRPGNFLTGVSPSVFLMGLATQVDPPMTSQGMVTITLDAKGRLEHLEALPPSAGSRTSAGRALAGQIPDWNWNSLLLAAGLDTARLTPSPWDPEAFVPVNTDSTMAWVGAYEEGRPDRVRVEAAALNGRPVFFRIRALWRRRGPRRRGRELPRSWPVRPWRSA